MVEFALVTPLLLLLVLALLQVALVVHTRSVVTDAAEDAVRVAASFGGDTTAGERRLRERLQGQLRDDLVQELWWASTLDVLTLRVRLRLPLVGPLGTVTSAVTASAWQEAWP